MKIAVIGSGVYGKAMARMLSNNKNEIIMWSEQDIKSVIVSDDIKVTNSYEEALKDAEIVYILTGSKFTENVFNSMKPYVKDDMIIVLGSKGILGSGKLITDVFETILNNTHLAVISGPTFAVDVGTLP